MVVKNPKPTNNADLQQQKKQVQQESAGTSSVYSVSTFNEPIVFTNPYLPPEYNDQQNQRVEETPMNNNNNNNIPSNANLVPSAPPLPPPAPPTSAPQPPPTSDRHPHHAASTSHRTEEPAVRFVLVHDRPTIIPANRNQISLEEYERRKRQARNMLMWNILLPGVGYFFVPEMIWKGILVLTTYVLMLTVLLIGLLTLVISWLALAFDIFALSLIATCVWFDSYEYYLAVLDNRVEFE